MIRQALQSGESSAAQPTLHDLSLAPQARSSGLLFSPAGTTGALRPPDIGRPSRDKSAGAGPVQAKAKAGRGQVRSRARRPDHSVLSPKRGAVPFHATNPTPAAERAAGTLRWNAVANATYYNVVLWRDGKRSVDLWPTSPRVVLPATPVNRGPQARLSPGRYLWFAYPGFGAKSSRRYGALAGSGVLVVQPKGGKWRIHESRFQ
jgi:hypothetical protein